MNRQNINAKTPRRNEAMIKKAFSFAPLILCAFALKSAAQTNLTFTNLQGKVYDNVILVSHDPVSISVIRHIGYQPLRVDFTNLPQEMRDQFHYDSAKEAEFRASSAANAKRWNANLADFTARKASASATEREVIGEVLQVVDDGVLFNVLDGITPEKVQLARDNGIAFDYSFRRTLIMLWHYQKEGLADGQMLDLKVYPIGSYRYATVNKASKTVPRLSDSVLIAMKFASEPQALMFQNKSDLDTDQLRLAAAREEYQTVLIDLTKPISEIMGSRRVGPSRGN